MAATCSQRRAPVLVIAIFVLTMTGVSLPVLTAKAQEGETVLLTGRIYDQDTGQGLADVKVQIENGWSGGEVEPQPTSGSDEDAASMPPPDGRDHQTFTVFTGPNGTYEAEVRAGWVHLEIDHPGYQRVSASGEVRANTSQDIPMHPTERSGAVVTGTVVSSQGNPIGDAWVSISRDWETRCDGDVCYAEDAASTSASAQAPRDGEGGSLSLYYQPRFDQWDSANTGQDGTFRLEVAAGDYRLQANAADHLNKETKLSLAEGDTRQVQVTLQAVPPSSVTVRGTITDAQSGEPVSYARVNVENQRWGHYEGTQTGQDGTFELTTKPGYSIFHVSADRHYWVPCNGDGPQPLDSDGGDQVTSSQAQDGTTEDKAIAPGEPYPVCEPQEREHGYLTVSIVRTFEAGQTVDLSQSLRRAPAPDAGFQGWVINASSEEGIPDAQVSFWNEITNEWGQATTDEDGSYTIDVRAGYYTVRVWADGYYQLARNVEVASGETPTLVLELTPGRTQHGSCCYAMERAVAMEEGGADDGAVGAPAIGSEQGSATSMDASRQTDAAAGQSGPGGEATFRGSGGGLGPYPGQASDADGPGDGSIGNDAPGLGLLALLGVIGLAAAAGRRRTRR